MSHYYTSCANIMIGSRLAVPELAHESDSEGETPLVTPIHTNFGNISKPIDGAAGILTGLDRLTCGEYNHLDKHSLKDSRYICPSAPRIDSGFFERGLVCDHESSSGLDITVDSSVNSFKDNYSVLDKMSAHPQHSLGPGDSKYSQTVRRSEAALAYEDSSALEGCFGIWTVPRAPRPDTGSWSSGTENAAPTARRSWINQERVFQSRPQLYSVTPSASVKSGPPKHVASNGKAKPAEQLTPVDASTRIVKWNLGLGLTLDDIAEPDGCGASVGETSMEFAEDSFFDLDTDSGYCSTADTTLNTSTETIPDLVMPCPNNPVGSVTHGLGAELGITPRSRMLPLQDHHENVKRQRTQNSTTSGSGTRRAYTAGFLSETDLACLVGRLGMDDYGGFRGLSNAKFIEPPLRTVAGESGEPSLNEAQGRSEHQMADAPIFALLPPIEL